ncbi:MAG: 4-phosphoerythronate dehydrogenase [Bacteroidota bacterium]
MLIVADAKNSLVNTAFRGLGEVRTLPTKEITRATLKDADVVIVRSETRINADLLEGTSVRFVATATIGTDHVDRDYLDRSGIGFANAPGSNANSVAEYLVAALLVLAREKKFSLQKSSIAIIGVGAVGSRVERIARTLGMDVFLNDPPLARMTGDPKYLPLQDLLHADIVSLHVPLTSGGDDPTYHLFDDSIIGRLKQGSILVNTSRGGVVETDALKTVLRGGRLAGAVLDVWENEPHIDTDLLELSTIGTPHIAGYSLDGKVNAAQAIFRAIGAHFGLSASWELDKKNLPGPQFPLIRVEDGSQEISQTLLQVVRNCYDIEADDARLREMLALSPGEREGYFRALRSGYAVRREFCNSTVHLPDALRETGGILRALGFPILF